MRTSLEAKVFIPVNDLHKTFNVLNQIAKYQGIIQQHDTFFNSNQGYLKLREEFYLGKRNFSFSFYEKTVQKGVYLKKCTSFHKDIGSSSWLILRHALGLSNGPLIDVHKLRWMWFAPNQIIYLDRVKDKHYFKLVVPIPEEANEQDKRDIADNIIHVLFPAGNFVLQSYSEFQ
jgi:adenylate cyclase class IV